MNNTRHNRALLQSGKGIGGIFHALARIIKLVIKKAAPAIKSYVKSAPVQRGLKNRKKAIQSAVNTTSDLIAGQNPKERLKNDMVKIANITSNTELPNQDSGKVKKRNVEREKEESNIRLF